MLKKDTLYTFTSHSDRDTEQIGHATGTIIMDDANPVTFVALYGNLGAGKTAFVRGMAEVLAPGAMVSSPTYSIVNVYESPEMTFYHLDLYRITDDDDLWSIGFYELLDDKTQFGGKPVVLAAEWCENIPFALPDSFIKVTITRKNETERLIVAERVNRI